ncbi:MAG: hypothetical protein DMG57_41570 [Acidobacteria bacterium]|nr:MAG: hypothetical protein DMG57_41570 [Acidobacteriota bacterium]
MQMIVTKRKYQYYIQSEQLEGKEADARTDIFALGTVIYEMVIGRRAFEGASQASVIAAILEREPPSAGGLASATLNHVLRRCLAKDPDDRWQTARDLKAELQWIAESGSLAASVNAPKRATWRKRSGWIAAATLFVTLTILLFAVWHGRPLPTGDVVRFAVYPPAGTAFSGSYNTTLPVPQFALSPDGRAISFAAAGVGASPILWLRWIAEVTAQPLPGTEGAVGPFWSPDSRWVGFFAQGKLKKISSAGGAVQAVAEGVPDSRGGTWNRDDTILFAYGNSGLYRVPAAGGPITSVTKLASRAEGTHRWPQFLPDNRHFLFTIRGSEQGGVFAGSLDGNTKKLLVRFDSSALYAPPGYLLWLDGDTLLAQTLDADRLELRGQPFAVAEGVGRSSASDGAMSTSHTGTLAYAGAILRHGRLTWFDRSGTSLDSVGTEGDYPDFRLSPDEKQLAMSLVDPKTNNTDIWLTDLARGGTFRLTFGQFNAAPVWSPDGVRLLFRTTRAGLIEFYQKSAFGGGNEEPVMSADVERAAGTQSVNLVPTDWSPDGRYIIFSAPEAGAGFDLWLLPRKRDAKPVRFLGSTADEMHGNFSPDGKFVAYTSNESGRFEVYVETFPRSDRRWPVSTNGGYEPRWRADGREIYYLSADQKLMAVTIGAGPSFAIPKVLFQTHVPAGVHANRTHYVPTLDGRRFLINTQSGELPPNPITVVLNWTAGLKR